MAAKGILPPPLRMIFQTRYRLSVHHLSPSPPPEILLSPLLRPCTDPKPCGGDRIERKVNFLEAQVGDDRSNWDRWGPSIRVLYSIHQQQQLVRVWKHPNSSASRKKKYKQHPLMASGTLKLEVWMHRALYGWMLARAPASPTQGLHHHGPWYFILFLFSVWCVALRNLGLLIKTDWSVIYPLCCWELPWVGNNNPSRSRLLSIWNKEVRWIVSTLVGAIACKVSHNLSS